MMHFEVVTLVVLIAALMKNSIALSTPLHCDEVMNVICPDEKPYFCKPYGECCGHDQYCSNQSRSCESCFPGMSDDDALSHCRQRNGVAEPGQCLYACVHRFPQEMAGHSSQNTVSPTHLITSANVYDTKNWSTFNVAITGIICFVVGFGTFGICFLVYSRYQSATQVPIQEVTLKKVGDSGSSVNDSTIGVNRRPEVTQPTHQHAENDHHVHEPLLRPSGSNEVNPGLVPGISQGIPSSASGSSQGITSPAADPTFDNSARAVHDENIHFNQFMPEGPCTLVTSKTSYNGSFPNEAARSHHSEYPV